MLKRVSAAEDKTANTPGANGHPKIHSGPVRWMHWLNFPLIALMVWSGLRIYWADRQGLYSLGIGDKDFELFPMWFDDAFNLRQRLARGMAYHFTFGWFLVLNGALFLIYTARSGHWREIFPAKGALKNALQVVAHDLKLSKKPLPEQSKYNAAQQFAYTGILVITTITVLTGFAIYKPTQLSWLTSIFGGYEAARWIHFTTTIMIAGFFAIHIAQVIKQGLPGFLAMVTGFYRGKDEDHVNYDAVTQTASTADIKGRERRNLIVGAAGTLATLGTLKWLGESIRTGDRIPAVLRSGHRFNEAIWKRLHRDSAKAPEFSFEESSMMRVNGRHGLRTDVPNDWAVEVFGPDGQLIKTVSLDQIKSLPKVEHTVEHKCVEGWSHVVTWGGTTFADFVKWLVPEIEELPQYVNLECPTEPDDDHYYVSLDIESMMHPQTLLSYEMQRADLLPEHGAPLRLTTPLKYGIKQIKRIGSISFSNERGRDYWEERGYDWYSHL